MDVGHVTWNGNNAVKTGSTVKEGCGLTGMRRNFSPSAPLSYESWGQLQY